MTRREALSNAAGRDGAWHEGWGTVPKGRWTGCPAGLRGARRADAVQRAGLALAVPVLPVGAVDFHEPHVVVEVTPTSVVRRSRPPYHPKRR